jgi:anti-sigma regulatory factor (Ser/Thr protein kinase)
MGASPLHLVLPAEAKSVFAARQALSQYVMGEGVDLERVRTAVSEAIGNAVIHAYRGHETGSVELRAEWTDEGLLVTVSDQGVGMTPNIDSGGLGLGLALIGKVSDRFEIAEGQGVKIRMVFANPKHADERLA